MAKHNRGEALAGDGSMGEQSERRVFQLVKGEYEPVTSEVRSLNIATADGAGYKVPKENLVKSDGATLRFTRTRRLPFPRQASDRMGVVQAINDFMDALAGFDASDAWALPNGQTKARGFSVLVNHKGEPITAEQYVMGLLRDGHTLANQKVMQGRLRDEAEATLRNELGIVAPDKKVRVKKTSVEQEDSVDESDE